MAAPKDSPEQAFRLRKFQGTNTEIDSTFLGPSVVNRSENWIPTQSFRLGKRPGTALLHHTGFSTVEITSLCRNRDVAHLYLYAYCQQAGGTACIAQSLDEGPFTFDTPGPGVSFTNGAAIGRMIGFRDRVYAGNGVDPLVSWKLGDPPANTLRFSAIGETDTTGATVVAADPPGGPDPVHGLPAGTYQYCWAYFDSNKGVYLSRSAAKEVIVGPGQIITATSPTAVLAPPPGFTFRLFIAYRGYPIEYATAQGPDWPPSGPGTVPNSTRTVNNLEVTTLRVPLYGGAGLFRTGNMFVVWRNRVVFSGMRDDPTSVFATDTILPGLEQQIFNQGTMFPVNAKVPLPAVVTGLGVAGVTTDMDASAPLLFFTLSKTFICSGDPFSTVEPATMVEVSSRIGCIGHDSIVNTPVGTIFAALDSVYLIPPGGGYPQDIGWPIANEIRAIPPGLRSRIVATFHKQFYKIAIPTTGTTSNTIQWWLDLRQGVGDFPSWWGPHSGPAVSAFATDPSNTAEIDRGYSAQHATDVVLHHHVPRLYSDYNSATNKQVPLISRLRSGRFDADQPFIVKVITRLRLIAQVSSKSDMGVAITTDGGVVWTDIDPIHLGEDMEDPGQFVSRAQFPGAGPPTWAGSHWNPPPTPTNRSFGQRDPVTRQVTISRAKFGTVAPVEVQTISPYTRPRGLSIVVTLTHGPMPEDKIQTATNVELRDFELLFFFSERKVRYTSFAIGGRAQRPERISK